MFTSTEWENCKWSRTAKGKAAYSTVLNMNFWNGVTLCLKVFAPLVKVLRLVDGGVKPSMGFLYGELKNAKEEIKVVLRNNGTCRATRSSNWYVVVPHECFVSCDIVFQLVRRRTTRVLRVFSWFLRYFDFFFMFWFLGIFCVLRIVFEKNLKKVF
ncbi:hypothetical protein ACOSQ4_018326 [Xanthoceras sorbifolium]